MNILAIGAHPDDVENSCAGTLAKYAKQGHKIFTATATNGNIGSATIPMDEIARIRKEEARRAAEIIGAEYICLDYNDEMFFEDRDVRLAFIDLVRYCKADIILTHSPKDYNPDHMLTGKIVTDIPVMIPIAKLPTKNKPVDKIPLVVYWEPVHGFGFEPTEYVDITEEFETKVAMCNEHKSQVIWMQENYKEQVGDKGKNFVDDVRIIAEYRGMQCGVQYAEAFRMAYDAYRVAPYRVLP